MPPHIDAAAPGLVAVALGDVDGDADLDVVIANWSVNLAAVLLNRRLRRPPNLCPADVDGDGYANAGDFSILAVHFGESVSPGSHGDLNGDGVVDIRDFLVFAAGFGCGP